MAKNEGGGKAKEYVFHIMFNKTNIIQKKKIYL